MLVPVKKQTLCDRLIEAIKDEGVASIDYGKLAEELADRPECELKSLRILFEKISQDEKSHKFALDKVARLVCDADTLSRLRG